MTSCERRINVIVTGGGAYDAFDYNTAADIRDRLPSIILRAGKLDIRIFRYPVDTPCTYDFGIQAMDEIWSGKAVGSGETMPTQRVDLALHLGMRPSYPGYCIETHVRKNVCKQAGEDGQGFHVSMVEVGGPWAELPDCLYSNFNMEGLKTSLVRRTPASTMYS
ncbi:hypothetical protein BKA59DRAFT_452429 [Fusarium tricinctum]|uniref:Uncharacterized protein n=1 Tax=Fusarium tricinctum TaxID=61284 RepID=A0A8K0RWC2_9HYPO|nr:hypothetical protein BKA59DRAFT_452429 [Fusarium tricinctum]